MKYKGIYLMGFVCLFSCNRNDVPDNIDFKQEMRDFVQGISTWSKAIEPGFLVIPQNGEQLASETEPGRGRRDQLETAPTG